MNFKEAFLHFIWQYQLLDKSNLQTTAGESISILKQGHYNSDAGPDFLDSTIMIGRVCWVGAVEIHLATSDWYKHSHQHDPAYEKVVLHVVWMDDKPLVRNDGTIMPTLVLKDKVDRYYIEKYRDLLANKTFVPCQQFWPNVTKLAQYDMFDKALLGRQERKIAEILKLFSEVGNSWEETAYQLLGKYFGFHVNTFPFQILVQRLPHKILLKHADNLVQMEALLFGVAGFLQTTPQDHYQKKLKDEYEFLKHKYGLNKVEMGQHEWKYLRLRPANFPTIRIAQFAAFIHVHHHLYSFFTNITSCATLIRSLQVTQSSYWIEHYKFGYKSKNKIGKLGKTSIEGLVINVVVPILFALTYQRSEPRHAELAIALLEHLPAEKNRITQIWSQLGLKVTNAFQSQASIELYNQYCSQRKCLNCAIGFEIMKKRKC